MSPSPFSERHHDLPGGWKSPVDIRGHWSRKPYGALLILALCGLFYLPGLFTLPPIDRDESRFAEATRRMLASGDWRDYVVPKIQDRIRLNKPPLIYWLQAASVRLLRGTPAAVATPASISQLPVDGIWAYRLPSLLGALAAVLITWQLGRQMFAHATAGWAALLLGLCGVVAFDVRQARTDEVLLALLTLAHWALWQIWSAQRKARPVGAGWVLAFWLAIGLAAMTKSLVAPAVVGMTVVTLCVLTRQWAWLRELRTGWGLLLLVIVIGPWVLLVVQQVGWRTLGWNVVRETFGRGVVAMEGHRGLPGYYLVLLPVLLWPGSLALLPGLSRMLRRAIRLPSAAHDARSHPPRRSARATLRTGWRRWRQRQPGRSAEVFCLAWLLGGWVLFEVARTKLPHYTLPLYPAAALVCARALLDAGAWRGLLRGRVGRGALAGWIVLTGMLALVLPIGLIWAGGWRASAAQTVVLGGLLTLVAGLLVLLVGLLRRRRFVAAQLAGVGIAAVGYIAVFQLILPNLSALWLSSRIVAHVRAVDPAGVRPLAACGYEEDSLVFLTRGRVQRLRETELPGWLEEHPDGLAIVTDRSLPRDVVLETAGEEAGFNYSNGQWQVLYLVPGQPGPLKHVVAPAPWEQAPRAGGAEPANRAGESAETPPVPANAGPGRP